MRQGVLQLFKEERVKTLKGKLTALWHFFVLKVSRQQWPSHTN